MGTPSKGTPVRMTKRMAATAGLCHASSYVARSGLPSGSQPGLSPRYGSLAHSTTSAEPLSTAHASSNASPPLAGRRASSGAAAATRSVDP